MRFVSGKRFVLILALTLAAAIVTGVAESAPTTAVPEKMTGRWERGDGVVMVVGPHGKVNISKAMINKAGWYHAKFSHVTAHRLSISGPRSCSGTGTYRWGIIHRTNTLQGGYVFKLTKIHDACRLRVGLMIETDDAYSRASPA